MKEDDRGPWKYSLFNQIHAGNKQKVMSEKHKGVIGSLFTPDTIPKWKALFQS